MSRSPMLNVAVSAVRKAGNVLTTVERHRTAQSFSLGQRQELLRETQAILGSLLLEQLKEAYPQQAIWVDGVLMNGSETENSVWDITTIDGTTNFLHGVLPYAVVLSLTVMGRPNKLVMFDPVHNDLLIADQGNGFLRNDKKQRVVPAVKDQGVLLCALESDESNLQPESAVQKPMGLTQQQKQLLDAWSLWTQQVGGHWAFRSFGSPHLAAAALAGGMIQGMCLWHDGDTLPAGIRLMLMEAGATFLRLQHLPVWCAADGDTIESLVKKLNRMMKANNTKE